MVHGRQGFKLEAFKFGIYIFIPIAASIGFNNPTVQQVCADYFQFLKYPASPNTRLKEEFEEMVRKRELEREQRKKYMNQLRELNENAERSNATRVNSDEVRDDKNQQQGQRSNSWFRRWWKFA